MKTHRASRRGSSEAGFALIVTLIMMVLLVIPAHELLSLSTISLRNSSQGTAAEIVRGNARLALMMAVGELQKEMGPHE